MFGISSWPLSSRLSNWWRYLQPSSVVLKTRLISHRYCGLIPRLYDKAFITCSMKSGILQSDKNLWDKPGRLCFIRWCHNNALYGIISLQTWKHTFSGEQTRRRKIKTAINVKHDSWHDGHSAPPGTSHKKTLCFLVPIMLYQQARYIQNKINVVEHLHVHSCASMLNNICSESMSAARMCLYSIFKHVILVYTTYHSRAQIFAKTVKI